MKHYSLIFILLILGLVSCEEYENSAEPSRITYLPKIELTGASSVKLDCGATSFTDPGAKALAGSTEITLNKSIAGAYFGGTTINGPDLYDITYSAYNEDSIPAAAFRSVLWPVCNSANMATSIEGMYTSSVVRNGSTGAQYQNMGPILIKSLGNNKYQLSDAIGGYYDFGRGYGPHYAATGMIVTANNISTNSFTYGADIGVGDFGGNLKMTTFTVNPADKTIKFTTVWDVGYTFVVTLTQATF